MCILSILPWITPHEIPYILIIMILKLLSSDPPPIDILSGTYSDIIYGILADIYSDILSGTYLAFYLTFYLTYLLSFYLAFYLTFIWHSFWQFIRQFTSAAFGARDCVPAPACPSGAGENARVHIGRRKRRGRDEKEVRRRGEKLRLFKSRDLHLAGGELIM